MASRLYTQLIEADIKHYEQARGITNAVAGAFDDRRTLENLEPSPELLEIYDYRNPVLKAIIPRGGRLLLRKGGLFVGRTKLTPAVTRPRLDVVEFAKGVTLAGGMIRPNEGICAIAINAKTQMPYFSDERLTGERSGTFESVASFALDVWGSVQDQFLDDSGQNL